MLPAFDANGYLPPGIHRAPLEEIADRFGRQSELRRVQMESLRWLADLVHRAGAKRLILNGSFISEELEPNDVDCVVLIEDDSVRDPGAVLEMLQGLPFLDIQVVKFPGFQYLVETVFATDRREKPKGVVEVIL